MSERLGYNTTTNITVNITKSSVKSVLMDKRGCFENKTS